MAKQKNSKIKTITKSTPVIVFLLLSISAFVVFLIDTGFISNQLLMIILALVLVYPVMKSSKSIRYYVKYYICCLIAVFLLWLAVNLGVAIIPFVFSIMIGYILDPVVTKLEHRGLARWLSALIVVLVVGGALVAGGIFIFPLVVEQLQTIVSSVGEHVAAVQDYMNSGQFYTLFDRFDLPREAISSTITKDLLPKIEFLISTLFDSLLQLFLSFSNIATHILNLVVLPFLTFYFLKDLGKIKRKASWILKQENKKMHYYFKRFDTVLKTYIIWQITAAFIVFTISSIFFTLFDVPYGILLAAIAGLINPLPYFGTIFSLIIGSAVILLVNDANIIAQLVTLFGTILGVHFLNAYLLEPNIAGNKVGMHPVLMILSVFVFHSIFGVLGMLVAVPITSVFVLAVKEALSDHLHNKLVASINTNLNEDISEAEPDKK